MRLNWLRALLPQALTAYTAETPTGNALAALAIKSETGNYTYDSTRPALDLLKGTVAACINARASERGVLKFIVRENGQVTTRTRALANVLDTPNPVQSRVDFMECLSQFHDACGNATIYVVNGDGGLPAEWWIIPSFFVEPLFDNASDPVPAAYRWADGRVIAEDRSLIWIRNNSIKTAPYTGRGFLADQLDSAILYDLVVKGQKNWFYNGGAPNVAITAPKGTTMTLPEITAMQKLWHDKYNPATGSSNIGVLPDGMTVTNFGPAELNFQASKDELRDSIREALQTPKIILGDTDNVNHNNGQTALAMFERLVVLRWGQKVAAALQHYAKQHIGHGLTVEIDPEVTAGFTQLPASNTPTVEREFPFPAQN